ncbi:MAG: hypothetical protein IJ365_07015, partial [Clostridia bacterium]|nr:hypothetical protein [Clostridia bacterium]
VINSVTGAASDYSYLPGSTVDLSGLAVGDGFLGYSLESGSTDYITSVAMTDDVTIYANYLKIEDIVWDFEDNTAMGWVGLNTHSVDTSGASLKLYYSSSSSKADLWGYIQNLEVNASNYKYIVIEMRHNIPEEAFGSKPLEVFFKRSTDAKWGEQLSANAVQLPASTGYKKYVIDMSACPNWNGTITHLRIDPFETTPAEDAGYWAELDSIRLCSSVEQRNVIYSLDSYDELAGTWGNAAYSSTAGTDGYDDTAISAVSTSVKERNVFLSEVWDVSKFGDDKYVVYQVDVKFGPNGDNFFVATNGHQHVSSTVYKTNPKIKTDDWNTTTVVSEADGGATKVYINGIYDCSGKSYVTRDNYPSTINCIRFVSYASDENDLTNTVASYDNILVYTTDTPPKFADELLTGAYSADSGATYTTACNYGALIVAAYNGDTMLDVRYINLTDKQNTVTLNVDGATKYKGFVWNSMTNIKPMCAMLLLDALNN